MTIPKRKIVFSSKGSVVLANIEACSALPSGRETVARAEELNLTHRLVAW